MCHRDPEENVSLGSEQLDTLTPPLATTDSQQ